MTAARLAIHAGAGSVPSAGNDPTFAVAARRGLEASLSAGHAVLFRGGSALEAVVHAVAALEDCEVFNAGRGSVLTRDGQVEMDAAVMNGADRAAGAVAGVRGVLNPVRGALAVMQHSDHVLMVTEGAEALAREAGLPFAAADHFVTAFRRDQLARAQARGHVAFDYDVGGTVGAVALDTNGHVAAATSTGGLTNKLSGRISDSCQIGAGTWADDATCAVSGTGRGELFIRGAFAHEIDALMRHNELGIEAACERSLANVLSLGGDGGCIAIDPTGRLALPFNTSGMPRGWIGEDGCARVAVHPEDTLEL